MIAGIFQPDVWTWLFGPGVGTNIGAWLVCGCLGFAWGVFLGKRAFGKLHRKLDEHHRWQHQAMRAINHGEPLPPHPHFDTERTP
jgi:hypothetical protein